LLNSGTQNLKDSAVPSGLAERNRPSGFSSRRVRLRRYLTKKEDFAQTLAFMLAMVFFVTAAILDRFFDGFGNRTREVLRRRNEAWNHRYGPWQSVETHDYFARSNLKRISLVASNPSFSYNFRPSTLACKLTERKPCSLTQARIASMISRAIPRLRNSGSV
jgi:hypothetical protein